MITGKPGSGKSTFMKFISGHEQTQSALDTWSEGRKLVVASFYFWSSGTPLQRSQDGLLRCLLYKILSQMPDMIPVAVPQRWQVADQPRVAQPWSRKEIFDAFAIVVNANLLSTKFCFFIDGLDEYGGSDLGSGGTDLDLVLQLKTLSSSPCVKLCLSSRPRNLFQGHFPTNGPHHITLHDHTTKDIERFVESRIYCVQGLVSIESADLEELAYMIVARSSGVFLWVVLVVRELLDGLEPPFSMSELEERLLMLPATLDGYFQRILDNVHQQYRRFNARLLLMSTCATVSSLELPIVHSLWSLESSGNDSHHHAEIAGGRSQLFLESKDWETATFLRVHKTCGDFLTAKLKFRGHIEFNHRSVADFLEVPTVREHLLVLAEWHDESDIYLMLCRLFVSCFQADYTLFYKHYSYFNFGVFFRSLAEYEYLTRTTCADLLYKLDSILSSEISISPDEDIEHWTSITTRVCHPEWASCGSHEGVLLLCMITWDVTLSVEEAIKSLSSEAQIIMVNDLLRASVLGCFHSDYGLTMSETVEFLFSQGANINSLARATIRPTIQDSANVSTESVRVSHTDEKDLGLDPRNAANEFADCTIWELYLQERDFALGHLVARSEAVRLAVKLIEAGADLKCRLPENCGDIEDAIMKRLEADINWNSDTDERVEDGEIDLSDEHMNLIRSALEERGVFSRDYDTDESVDRGRCSK
jgi:hypothetical protein